MHPPTISWIVRLPGPAGAGLLVLGAGCYQVPVMGRTAINMVSDTAVNRLSQEAFEKLKKSRPISRNPARDQSTRLGERLARVAFWNVPNAQSPGNPPSDQANQRQRKPTP
jgi:hypothetical protein